VVEVVRAVVQTRRVPAAGTKARRVRAAGTRSSRSRLVLARFGYSLGVGISAHSICAQSPQFLIIMSIIAVKKNPEKIIFAWDTQTKRYGQAYYDGEKVIHIKNIVLGFVGKTRVRPYLKAYVECCTSKDTVIFDDAYSVCAFFDKFREEFLPSDYLSFDESDNILISDSKKVFNIDPSTNECFEIQEFEAIGSGGDIALGAYKAGADIVKACEIACELNLECGEPVELLEIPLSKSSK